MPKKTIAKIYDEYGVMPQLVMHQLRVAAVAHVIVDAFSGPLHVEELISACLLHDMANILKFDLSYFPEFLEPQGLAYWEGVKEGWREKYGSDEHAATLAVARKIGVSELTLDYIDAVGFSNAVENQKSNVFEKKIAPYADMRVAPHGILSLAERMDDANRRYASRYDEVNTESKVAMSRDALRLMEQQIFARTDILPADITDASCEKYIVALKSFQVA
jgi:hypothetical protein